MYKVAVVIELLASFLAVSLNTSSACEITTKEIHFPGMGKHVSYYCKASEAEKKQALSAMQANACISQKYNDYSKSNHQLSILATEVTDVTPYWFTKEDAEKAGPVLDCRIILSRFISNGLDRAMGFRALALGHKIAALRSTSSRFDFDISDATVFYRDCPSSGCGEKLKLLCDQPT